MKKKLTKNNGFTLIEMLVVVAIIAILIAVSIPLLNNALERARDSTDQANERAAKAAASLVFMQVAGLPSNAKYTGTGTPTAEAYYDWNNWSGDTAFYYDAASGELWNLDSLTAGYENSESDIEAYGKCTKTHTDGVTFAADGGTDAGDHVGKIIEVTINPDGSIKLEWTTENVKS